MKPSRFRYLVPETVDEAVALLAEHGSDAKVLAGGQSLVPLMNLRLVQPAFLVDITRIPELQRIGAAAEGLSVGAAVRQADVEDDPGAPSVPLLAEALPHVAHREIRNAGTVCGSLAHADPASELPAVAVATGAELVARSVRGERRIAADEFFAGFLTTALEPDELLASVRFPAPAPRTGSAFLEVAPRAGDYALAGVAAAVTLANGHAGDVRLAYVGVEAVPVRGTAGEQALAGQEPTEDAIAEAARAAAGALDPRGDLHATPAFRRNLAEVLTRRALAIAVERAARGNEGGREGP